MNNLINYKLNDTVPFKTSSTEGVRCQGGGGQQHTLSTTASYGYTGSRGFKTSHYAPITKDVTAHNQCGGKKKRKSRKKRKEVLIVNAAIVVIKKNLIKRENHVKRENKFIR